MGVAVNGSTHTVYVANSSSGDVAAFGDVRPIVTTGAPSQLTDTSVTLTAHIDPAGRGAITECRFEYGFDKGYGNSIPCSPDPAANPPSSNFNSGTDVTATISNLSPGTSDHYRVVATNVAGATSFGADRTFSTTQAPAIDGLAAEHLTATTAELIAQVNPNGLETKYRFEYGTTTSYGQEVAGTIPAGSGDQEISTVLTNLAPHSVYHFRLVAENSFENQVTHLIEGGVTTSEDHLFNFYPPSCPNENVRQQTQANYLPDCRAYELVSPGNANGTQLFSGGPNTGRATRPSRLSFTGLFSSIPEAGGSPLDTAGDLYVATRTPNGWVTKYVGLPSNEAAVDGGPPMGLPGQGGPGFLGNRNSVSTGVCLCADIIQNNVLTNPSMDVFLDWNDGTQGGDNPTPIGSNAPYVWNANGTLLDRWPSNLGTVPNGSYPEGSNIYPPGGYVLPGEEPLHVAPGGLHALDCPAVGPAGGGSAYINDCPGEINASSDLSHFVFATEWNVFAHGGQLGAPGSIYDNNTNAGTVTVASKTPAGEDIPNEPTDEARDPLQIPAVSSDGSRILMSAPGTGPCGLAHCPTPPCGGSTSVIHCPTYPGQLYMRVDGAVTYDVSKGVDVAYVGMTADGSKVYFTTAARLTPEDTDSSVDLYMWTEATDTLTLASKGSNGEGNSDSCQSSFTKNCGVVTYSNLSYCRIVSGLGGNCRSDNSIAASEGDIYFFSPELLDGSRGIPNQENIYDFRNGAVQYVATVEPGAYCFRTELASTSACGVESDGPVVRMQVSPDDSYMAFVTARQVTQYDNAGQLEMYRYNPVARNVICVSCIPSGEPPTSSVGASQDGLFMTDNGRAFFTTDDALVHTDTNQAQDVYEYVDGHPQLITPGTGDTTQSRGLGLNEPGLDGVSGDGTDVYFSTYQTLVPQDHNGLFLKFYDARTGGGFPVPSPTPPCTAADECHGPGSSPPPDLASGTTASLGSGSHIQRQQKGKSRRHHRARHRHHHRARHAHRTHAVGNGTGR
jgi:hypothetical protein